MSKDIHKWSNGRYTLMFDEHTFFVFDNVKEKRMTALQTTKRLNEQQDTIFKLQNLCGESDGENAKLRIENKRLEKEVNLLRPTNIEQYEQIQKLQEENEKLKQKVDFYKYFQKDARELEKENEKLRENLHNCRLNKNIISEKLKLWQDVHKEYNIYNINDFEELMKSIKQKQ